MGTIVVPGQFIQATRDTGYRGLAPAIAELVDNAIDASASEIDITITEKRLDGEREITIAVLDNGSGMDKSTLSDSLRFGGSERFNDRDSLGRYGMGLPNSSVSQAPRVEVYTWRENDGPLRVHLDVDEIAMGKSRGVGRPVSCALPPGVQTKAPSGTLVQWSRCDRLRFKKASTLARKLRVALGRMYRHRLGHSLVIRVNGEPVFRVDPLFREPVDGLPGTCEPYGDPLRFHVKRPAGGSSTIEVQFVELPVNRWHDLPLETKRNAGIVGGAGISVLRGGREIDYGWHLFGHKRRENYDDWWRCELRFEPSLDELVGITHSKQGINPAPELRAILEPDLEQIARELNGRVRRAFSIARPPPRRSAAEQASRRDQLLPAIHADSLGRRSTGKGFQFQVEFHEEARPEFFKVEFEGAVIHLEINQNHPFYHKLYMDLSGDSDDIDLILLAAARALFDLSEDARQRFLRSWSDNLLAYLDR